MCGILIHDGAGNNFFIQKRGQDSTTTKIIHGIHFTHNLLHITGETVTQPFIDGEIVCMYNGEIYNHPFNRSDGENLIPLYREYGLLFPQYLDGEFAIVLFDFGRNIALYITDPFASKPLWRNGIYAASYESGVGGHKVPHNSIEMVRISTGDLINTIHYNHFDFTQYKDTYTDCIRALKNAIKKRAKHRCFIGLSSGYDSGVIACELRNCSTNFKCYSIVASEDHDTLLMRSERLGNVTIIDDFDHDEMVHHLAINAEEFKYNIRYDWGFDRDSYKKDWAARGLSLICKRGSEEGRNVYISGQGADEILSDYALYPEQSELKGVFPDHLIPWSNFHGSCQYSYLGKEECVAGSWNVETRYPFLDKQFVQEFLWLSPELKNRHYKAPLYEYLKANHFPFQENKKIGFCV